jgi:hypothetical protein
MYFFDLQSLIQQHKDNRFSAKDTFSYLVGAVVVDSFEPLIKIFVNTSTETKPEWYIGLAIWGFGILTACGVLTLFYRANGGSQGERLLERILSLSWVTGFRVLLTIPLMLLISVIGISVGQANLGFILTFAAFVLALIWGIASIRNSLQEISRHRSISNNSSL